MQSTYDRKLALEILTQISEGALPVSHELSVTR